MINNIISSQLRENNLDIFYKVIVRNLITQWRFSVRDLSRMPFLYRERATVSIQFAVHFREFAYLSCQKLNNSNKLSGSGKEYAISFSF